MPAVTHGGPLPHPLPDWQEWLLATLEEHRRSIRADIITELEPLRSYLRNGNSWESQTHISQGVSTLKDPCSASLQVKRLSTERRVSTEGGDITSQFGKSERSSTRRTAAYPFTITANDSIKSEAEVKEVILHVKKSVQAKSQIKLDEALPKPPPNTKTFDTIIAVTIMLNVLAMVIELEYQTYLSSLALGMEADSGGWNNAQLWFDATEHLFNAVFLVEIVIRLRLFRWGYFKSAMNLADLSLVLSTSVQIYILKPLKVRSGGQLTLFRMLRFCRTVRILKILRLKMFTALRVLVQTCISSMAALAWSMVLLFIIIIMSGIFLCNLLKGHIQDASTEHDLRLWLFRYYGSSTRATYTLFEVTLSGCWPNYFRPLIEKVTGWYSLFVILYISAVVFAVLRIITAIFLKQTLNAVANDADMVGVEQRSMMEHTMQKLAGVFKSLDVSGDGQLHFDEFELIISNPEVKLWLATLDVHVHDVVGLFQLLDDGDGTITYDEFLAGMLRLRGQARSLDLVALSRHCDKIQSTVSAIEIKVGGISDHLLSMGNHKLPALTPRLPPHEPRLLVAPMTPKGSTTPKSLK